MSAYPERVAFEAEAEDGAGHIDKPFLLDPADVFGRLEEQAGESREPA